MDRGLHSERYLPSSTFVSCAWFLDSQVRDHFEGVVEAVGEIGGADDEGEFDDLSGVEIFLEVGERGGADSSGAARHAEIFKWVIDSQRLRASAGRPCR
jgi:hypothetical protein